MGWGDLVVECGRLSGLNVGCFVVECEGSFVVEYGVPLVVECEVCFFVVECGGGDGLSWWNVGKGDLSWWNVEYGVLC